MLAYPRRVSLSCGGGKALAFTTSEREKDEDSSRKTKRNSRQNETKSLSVFRVSPKVGDRNLQLLFQRVAGLAKPIGKKQRDSQ